MATNDPRRKKKPASAGSRHAAAKKRSVQSEQTAITRRKRRPIRTNKPGKPASDAPKVVYTPAVPITRARFFLGVATAVAVVLAFTLAFSIFFKVRVITVSGARQYTPRMIVEASGVREGDNLLSFGEIRAMGKIKAALPYIEQVKIGIKLPDTVNIDVVELDVTYAIAAEDGTWWLMSSQGKVVAQTDATSAVTYTKVTGVVLTAPMPGQAAQVPERTAMVTEPQQEGGVTMPAAVTNQERLQAALTILQSLEANGVIGEAQYIDVSSMTGIELQYGEQYLVNLGDGERLPYKIEYMCKAINQMPSYQTGSLDLSFKRTEEGIFTPSN